MSLPALRKGRMSALMPLFLLWLAAHAVLLAAILGLKFLLTKTVLLAMVLAAGAAFVFTRFRVAPRKYLAAP